MDLPDPRGFPDNRITSQRYGQVFFDSLPHYGFTTKLEDVEKFFDV